ncbi:MAG: hypothetical protein EBR82_38140 [Caulobacteraceae bacterium]|nr:hypothetical protein [Caulobacteraceae bacterium]
MPQRVLVQTWDCGSVKARAMVTQFGDDPIEAHEIDVDQVELFGVAVGLDDLSPAVLGAIRGHFLDVNDWVPE